MATIRAPKPAASAKYDAFVQAQLDRARQRIRLLDVSSALLLFLAATLVYTLVVGLLDRKFDLAAPVRQAAFAGYAVAAVAFLLAAVLIPLCRRINPYFAARAVEGVVPGAKNSLVNWLDLHGETMPPAIRASLSQRAARDFGRADLEQAISGRRAVWLTGLTALFALALFGVFLTSGVGGFGTLLARTYAPFGGGATVTRTKLTLERPVNGDAVLGVGQAFNVAVSVEGRVPDSDKPDALKLLYRYRDGEPSEEQLLEPESGNVWMTVVPPTRTFNGFWYKVVGGDDATPEFHVAVRSTPLVERFEVTYHHRPYTGWADAHSRDANLEDLRGTEVELLIHTNRAVKEGRLDVETRDGKKTVPAELIADDPRGLRARLVLDQDGQYRVWFLATDNDSSVAATTYSIKAIADLPPKVELTKPAADVTLPANGTLQLQGTASDDIGVKELTLRLRLADGPALAPRPYRPDKTFRLADGGYPKMLDYRDFVALDQLKDDKGKPFPPAKGMVLEYWLAAADACDYTPPGPNRAESKHYKVNIAEPTPDKQQEQKERDQAAAEQKKHDRQQDEKLKQEEQKRQEEAREKEEKEKKDAPKQDPKNGAEPDKPKNDGDKDLEKTAQQARQAQEKQQKEEQRQAEKAETKGQKDGKGENKGDNQAGDQPPRGDAKPEGQKRDCKECAGKGQGTNPDGKQPDTGSGKSEGTQHQDAKAGAGKGQGQGDQQGTGSAKPDGPPKPDKGESKSGGPGDQRQNAATPKEHGNGQNGDQGEASAKGAGQESAGGANDKASAKGDQPSLARGTPKPGDAAGEPKGGQKGEGQAQGGAPKAEAKSGGPDKGDAAAVAKDDPNSRSLSSELQKREGDVRNGTDKESAEAEQWLEKLASNAKDREVRDLAGKILDEARKDRSSAPALPKGPPRDGAKDGPPCECKGGGNGQPTGAAKGGGKDGGEGKQQGKVGTVLGAGRNGGEGHNGQLTPLTPAQQALLQELQADEANPSPADSAHRRRAGVLQIDPKVDKDILKDLKMTPEEWEAFRKAYAEKLRREGEDLPASQGDTVGSRGAREVKADKSDPRGDKTGLGQVPPEFRGAFRDYTRRQSEKK